MHAAARYTALRSDPRLPHLTFPPTVATFLTCGLASVDSADSTASATAFCFCGEDYKSTMIDSDF